VHRLVVSDTQAVPPLESNYLAPNATFTVSVLVCAGVFAVLVVWPLVETVLRKQWGYLLGVLVLGPIGGLVWLLGGRRATTHSAAAAAQNRHVDDMQVTTR
jgi:hypothetical protein